jgi:LacI family transcriptional regulator
MAVTLRDVARKAKTDITSVSNTLRNSPRSLELTEATRRRILAAARELGYTRNAFAAAMRTGENKTIAVILSVDTTRDNIFT